MRAKLLLLLAVCMAVVVGAEMPGSSAETERDDAGTSVETTTDAAVGASISHPDEWVVERERVTYDGTRGFKLWKPDPGAARDHGGTPEVRVAVAPDLERAEIKGRVRERLAEYPDLRLTRETVSVGAEKLKGTAVGPIPGSTPYIEVYVPVEDRVYLINVYGTKLDGEGRRLLGGLGFDAPLSRSASSVDELPDASDPETFYAEDAKSEELKSREEAARRESSRSPAASGEPTRSASLAASQVPAYGESQIAEGCWRADSRFFVQTQQGYGANRSAYDGVATGFTKIGDQFGSHFANFWGQYTHGNLGYGRCVSTYYVNDMYALDYPLAKGDAVFSPFSGGTVTFAGRNNSHSNYGVFVTIRSDNGKYVNISAHLSALASGIRPGARVTNATVIGFAGDTGDPSIPVGTPHLHQGFYRYPGFKTDGSPYGGQGLQVIYHHYTGLKSATVRREPAGVYQFTWPNFDTSATRTKGEPIGN